MAERCNVQRLTQKSEASFQGKKESADAKIPSGGALASPLATKPVLHRHIILCTPEPNKLNKLSSKKQWLSTQPNRNGPVPANTQRATCFAANPLEHGSEPFLPKRRLLCDRQQPLLSSVFLVGMVCASVKALEGGNPATIKPSTPPLLHAGKSRAAGPSHSPSSAKQTSPSYRMHYRMHMTERFVRTAPQHISPTRPAPEKKKKSKNV